jgi:hypothetical protein
MGAAISSRSGGKLAEAWAQYCDGEEPTESKVVRLAGRAG